nr:GDT1-like protein 4 [Quercus suber]
MPLANCPDIPRLLRELYVSALMTQFFPPVLSLSVIVEEKLEAGQGKTTYRRFLSRFCTPIFLESFVLTFLAEWGDRSQIATIALATHKAAIGVAVGAIIGHTICTSVAVVGGSMLASKISQRTVAAIGGLLFLGFSLSSYFYPPL